MHQTPAGLQALPIAAIDSTLTFTGSGASGQRGAIDGNLDTAAADPGGFNIGTVLTIWLRSPSEVSGLRILSAGQYGIENPGTLRIACEQDGSRELGLLEL